MTGRLVCVAVSLALATACGDTAAGGTSTAATTPAVVALGPLPTDRPVERVVTAIVSAAASSTTSRPTTTANAATTTAPRQAPPTSTPVTTIHVTPARTSCKEVAFIGDSVSLGMTEAGFDSRMAAVGVKSLHVEVSGGRSIVETLTGQENAATVATRLRADGFSGCWVVAIGTNDAANIAAGAARQADERIASMMAVIGRDPVLWIDAASIATDGFWAAPNIDAWNQVLTASAAAYANMRIARWSAVVHPEWFVPDGVHVTAAGTTARIDFVARQLITNFPVNGG